MNTTKILLFASMLTAVFAACNSDGFEEHRIGSDFIDKTANAILVDTFTINSSTVILDSLVSSGFSTAILGAYHDEFLGKINTEYYGILGLNGAFNRSPIDGNSETVPIRFDSLAFIIYPNSVYYGDSLQPQRLLINRLVEDTKLATDEYAFYAHSKATYDPKPLLDQEFYLNPVKQSVYDQQLDANAIEYKGKGLFFKMDNEEAVNLGKEIVALVNAKSDTLTNEIQWQKYMKGLAFRAGDDNTALFQVSLSESKMKLRLYYSDTDHDDQGVPKFHDFPVTTSGSNSRLSFLHYSSDRSSTPQQLDRLVEQKQELSSKETDNLSFVQGGVGLYTKVDISNVEDLITLGITGGILSAELVLYPKNRSYDDEKFLLPSNELRVYESNKHNQAVTSLGTFQYVQNYLYENESYYLADITSYVNNILINGSEHGDALLIGFNFDNIGNNFDRLIIENDPKSDFRIRLRVNYVIQR